MATLDRAQALLEELRQASIGGAKQDLRDVQEHAASQVPVHFNFCFCFCLHVIIHVLS